MTPVSSRVSNCSLTAAEPRSNGVARPRADEDRGVLVDERKDGVHLSYDKMASLLAVYGNSDALAVAQEMDSKIENFIREPAA